MGVLINLNLARLAGTFFSHNGWRASSSRLRVKNGHNVTQAISVLRKKGAELFFKLDFALQAIMVFEGLEFGQLYCELLLQRTEFCESGRLLPLYVVRRV